MMGYYWEMEYCRPYDPNPSIDWEYAGYISNGQRLERIQSYDKAYREVERRNKEIRAIGRYLLSCADEDEDREIEIEITPAPEDG